MEYRGVDIVIEYAVKEKVPYIIGHPGHSVMELIDAVYLRQDKIKPILVRHESVASFMADGFFRVGKKPLIVFGHISPGATNLLTGVANAFFDSSAMIVITGEAATTYQGKGAYQEMYRHFDAQIPDIFKPVVKRSWQINKAERLPEVMARAFSLALSGRPGPVHIDITQEASAQKLEAEIPDPEKHKPAGRMRGDGGQIEKAARLLASAERPAIIAGGGALISDASPELIALSELLGAPVGTTIMGKSAMPENNPLSMGTYGAWGTLPANRMTREADIILAIGTRFAEGDTSGWMRGYTFDIPPTKLLHVEIESYEIAKYYPTEVGIVADAKSALEDILAVLKTRSKKKAYSSWVQDLQKSKKEWDAELEKYRAKGGPFVHQGRVVREMQDMLPDEAVVVTDIGDHAKWLAQQFECRQPHTFVPSMGFAAMGFGVASAPGVKLAKPASPVICVCGDGGFSMLGPQALSTSVEYDIPVVFCIFNDFCLGPIRINQKTFYEERYLMSEFKRAKTGEPYNPNFIKLAEAYGAQGELVDSPEKFSPAFQRAVASGKPFVLDVRVEKGARWLQGGGGRVIRFSKDAK